MSTSKQQKNNESKDYLLAGILSVVVFVASAVIATSDELSLGEQRLFHLFFGLPDILTPLILVVTLLGSAGMLVVAVALALIRRQNILALELFFIGSTTYILVEIAKELIHRPRPVFFFPEILHREIFVYGFGFPSGHTAMATAISLTLWPYIPNKFRFIVPLWIGGVGFSRIYLGVHAPLDVVGGFALGMFVAWVFRFGFLSYRRKSAHQ